MSVGDRISARWRTCSLCGYREGALLIDDQRRCDHRWQMWERRTHEDAVPESAPSDDSQ